jgi:flagellar basal-body rod modification protein FlgD
MQIFANAMLPTSMAAAQAGMKATNDTTNDTTDGSSGSSATASSATITANDFLELLVTEMKNQDPTSQTDPDEYITQMVGVNSLEQLVQINQDLGGTTSDSDSSTNAVQAAGESAPAAAGGNLSPGTTTSAATRVASALGAAAPTPSAGEVGAGSRFDALVAAIRARGATQPTTINPAR